MAKTAKGKTRAKAAKISAKVEAQSKDAAHKIWLAGIGAYGRAYTEARDGALKLNSGTSEFFEDLVKRGAEIESDVLSRLASNERVTTATSRVMKARSDAEAQVTKMTGVATQFQEEQRERLEARMDQMRSVLGLGGKSDKASKLHAKLDRLEDEVANLRGKAKAPKTKAGKATKAAKADTDVAARLARLTGEIEAISAANAPAPKAKRKPVAKKKTVARKTRKTAATAKKKTVTKRPAAKKTTARKPRAKKA